MKTAIIISEGQKQIMLTPENDSERQALKMILPTDKIEIAIKTGSFSGRTNQHAAYRVGMNQAGYLRAWEDENSVMLVLTPQQNEEK